MLSAASESVLIAVDSMMVNRELPTPAMLGLKSRPPLTTVEVMTIAGLLVGEGYLRVGEYDGMTYYGLTRSGRDYADAVIARGT